MSSAIRGYTVSYQRAYEDGNHERQSVKAGCPFVFPGLSVAALCRFCTDSPAGVDISRQRSIIHFVRIRIIFRKRDRFSERKSDT